MQGQAVHRGGHAMFADAVMDIAAGIVAGLDDGGFLGLGIVRAGQVGGAADQFRQHRGQRVDHMLRGHAGGDLRLLFGGLLLEGLHRLVETAGQAPGQNALQLLAFLAAQLVHLLLPALAGGGTALADLAPGGQDVLGNLEGRMGPAQRRAGALDLLSAQRRAVGGSAALLLRRAIADDGLAGDQRRGVGLARLCDGGFDGGGVVAIHRLHVPAGSLEAALLVLRGGEAGRAIDGNAVIVEQHDQLGQLQMPSQRDGFLADALHQAAIAGDHIGEVIDNRIAETGVQDALAQCEADRGGDALAQRAGGGLDARRMAIFGMAGGHAAQLTEIPDLLDRHFRIAGEIEQAVEQHRAMARRQHEAVAVRPAWIGGVEFQEFRIQHRRHIGHAHRHAGVAGFRRFDGIHRQGADGVGHLLVRNGQAGLCGHDGATRFKYRETPHPGASGGDLVGRVENAAGRPLRQPAIAQGRPSRGLFISGSDSALRGAHGGSVDGCHGACLSCAS